MSRSPHGHRPGVAAGVRHALAPLGSPPAGRMVREVAATVLGLTLLLGVLGAPTAAAQDAHDATVVAAQGPTTSAQGQGRGSTPPPSTTPTEAPGTAPTKSAGSNGSAVLGFEQVLSLARQGPSVQLAAMALQQAEARRDASFGNLSASLKVGYSVTVGERNGASANDASFDPINLAATLNVVPYGPVWDGYVSAERAVRGAQLSLEDSRRQATADAASAYLVVLRAQQQVDVDRSAAALAQANQEHVEALAVKGDANAAAVLAAQLAATQAQATSADDSLSLEAALAQLGEVIGQAVSAVEGEPPAVKAPARPPTTGTTGADQARADAVPGPADADLASALARRSDVIKAQFDVDSAEASRAANQRNVLPKASLSADVRGGDGTTSWSGGLGYDTGSFQPSLNASVSPGGSAGSATNGTTLTLALGVTIPLDTATPPTLQANDLAVSAARARLTQVRDAATLAIRSAQRTLASRQRSADLARQQRRQRALLLEQAEKRFALGLVAQVDVDQAKIDLARSEIAASQADDAVLNARMNLALALGLDPVEVF